MMTFTSVVKSKIFSDYKPQKISKECLKGTGHFNKCSKDNCTCICHEMDGEVTHEERMKRLHPSGALSSAYAGYKGVKICTAK